MANWGDYEAELVDISEAPDGRVVSTLRQRGRGAGSGVAVESDLFMVWTIRDGRPVRMEMYLGNLPF